MFGVENMNK